MPFGKFRGTKLKDIASSDDGMSWLLWIIDQDWLKDNARIPIDGYLNEIADDVEDYKQRARRR